MSPKRRLCAAYIARCVDHGCNPGTAEYLAFHLKCDDRIFLHGYRWYLKQQQVGNVGSESRKQQRETKKVSLDAWQRHILRLVK